MSSNPFPKISALLRSHFFAGLLVIIPLGVIAWILLTGARLLWSLHILLPDQWRPVSIGINIIFTLGVALLLALGISILGWASKNYFGQKVLELIAEIIQRIPVVRSIYSALDQLLRTLATGSGQQFNRVVYVEYPRKGMWSLAFVTGPAQGPTVPPGHLNIFIPTTPNPTSGFHLLVPENEVRDSHMKVEEAFRTLLSLGIAQPKGSSSYGS